MCCVFLSQVRLLLGTKLPLVEGWYIKHVETKIQFYGWHIDLFRIFLLNTFLFQCFTQKSIPDSIHWWVFRVCWLSQSQYLLSLQTCWWPYYLFYLLDRLKLSSQCSFPNYLFNVVIELCYITAELLVDFFYIPRSNLFINIVTQYRNSHLPGNKQKLKMLVFLSKWKSSRVKWAHYIQKSI